MFHEEPTIKYTYKTYYQELHCVFETHCFTKSETVPNKHKTYYRECHRVFDKEICFTKFKLTRETRYQELHCIFENTATFYQVNM